MSGIGLEYNKEMLFSINGTTIPDPSSYDYSSQSLDTAAERDTTGYLHRTMVATKFNVALKWDAIDYKTAGDILRLIQAPAFTFSFPCPEIPLTQNGGLYSGKYYVGDRKTSMIVANDVDREKWICSLQFDLIEY